MLSTETANPSTVLDSLIVGAGISGLSLANALYSNTIATRGKFWLQKANPEWEAGL